MKKFLNSVLVLIILVGTNTYLQGQTFVGSDECSGCHSEKYNDWVVSGHPYKFNVIENNEPPTYPPFVTNFEDSWLAGLGDGTHTWEDIAGVIGGFGWKARFVGKDGHVVGTAGSAYSTGQGHNQINFYDGVDYGWKDYHPGDVKIYNYSCFKCHTTGGDTTGTWLTGVEGLGTFSEGGIGCESCHGPGSDHIASPSSSNIDKVYEFAHLDNASGGLAIDGVVQTPDPDGNDINFLCGTCHNRSYTNPINASGGFVRHHEQWDELTHTEHFEHEMTCATCHDPHKRTVWDGDGISMACATCHENQETTTNHSSAATCVDCHMPYAAKSGTTRGESGFKGDVRSHLFKITVDDQSMFSEDGSVVRDDDERPASLSPAYSCLGCHNDDPDDDIPNKTLSEVVVQAANMHVVGTQSFVGSEACETCHTEKYNDWVVSGHPYKFNIIENNEPPTYPPFVNNFEDVWMDGLGDGTISWDDIAGVIGGFGWKARFVGKDGHVVGTAGSAYSTGLGHNQINFYDGVNYGWKDYHPGDEKIYNYGCFKCHTTGGDTTGTWLAGVEGLGFFNEGGIGCESCHGPGSAHVAGPSSSNIDKVYEFAHQDNALGGLSIDGVVQTPDPEGNDVNFLCGTCHNRSYTNPINASGGFVRHHEQWDELTHTEHFEHEMSCATCHDPHKRTVWDGDGITMTCATCHDNQETITNHSSAATCIDCHMPYAAKSGTTRGESGYKGDVRSHLFKITVDDQSMFSEDGSVVRDDDERPASLSPAYTCLGCHNDDPDDEIPNKTLEEVVAEAANMHVASAATFVGSEECSGCHTEKYDNWIVSGHPYKFNVIENNEPPTYPPFVTNFEDSWMGGLGDGTQTWEDIAGVIGGFGWKARFVGKDGHLVGTAGSAYSTGLGHNQINFYDGVDYGWKDYHPGDVKIYNYSCFKCHTTGGDTTGSWLAGVEGLGTFTEGGIGCESCHGPGSNHVVGPSSDNIDKVYEFAHLDNASGGLAIDGVVQTPDPDGNDVNFLCGTCHNRSYTNPINSSGGFIKHHEQWDELTFTKHFENDMTCVTCHDPHKRTIWDGDGISIACADCHADQVSTLNHGAGATCIDCHMPYAAKSGTTRGESGFKGDVRSHLVKITVDDQSMFSEDGSVVRDDDERPASLSPAYTCLGCHNDDPDDNIPDKTLEEAIEGAKDMHGPDFISEQPDLKMNIYPNPTNGITNISFRLVNNGIVSIKVFNATGQVVYNMENEFLAGNQTVKWDSESNTGAKITSGYYFIKVTATKLSSIQKLVLIK